MISHSLKLNWVCTSIYHRFHCTIIYYLTRHSTLHFCFTILSTIIKISVKHHLGTKHIHKILIFSHMFFKTLTWELNFDISLRSDMKIRSKGTYPFLLNKLSPPLKKQLNSNSSVSRIWKINIFLSYKYLKGKEAKLYRKNVQN